MPSDNAHQSANQLAFKQAMVSVVALVLFLVACANARPSSEQRPKALPQKDWQTYSRIRNTLEKCGKKIDYDTLIVIYQTLATTKRPIAHMDELIAALINKRNENPRVDQMILIFAAKAIGGSKFPVRHVYQLLESILTQDDDRINNWVLSFVAEAIADYAEDIPSGDRLVDLVEQHLARIKSAPGPQKEYFGFHFLPPPKSRAVRAYLAGLRDQHTREAERRYYYALISKGISEKDIETQLKRLQNRGLPNTGKLIDFAMQYFYMHREQIR